MPTRPPANRTVPRPPAGSVLVLVIIAIVFLGALAAGVVSLLGTANQDTAVSNLGEKAVYNAESGTRFVAQQYAAQGDTDGDSNADEEKAAVLIALDGSTVNMPGTLGSFGIVIYPYWYVTTTSYTNANSISVRFPGTIPPNYAIPASGVLDLEDGSPHPYTGRSISGNTITFTMGEAVSIKSGKSVYMTLQPYTAQTVAAGGNLVVSSASQYVIPMNYPGNITVNDVSLTYSSATYDAANSRITLQGISKAVSVTTSDRVVLKKNADIQSTGQSGAGTFAAARQATYTHRFSDSVSPGGESTPGNTAYTNSNTNLGDYIDASNSFTVATYQSSDGTTDDWMVTDDLPTITDPDSTCRQTSNLTYATIYLNKNGLFSSAWQNATNHLLSYDIQLKCGWGNQLNYGAEGISFRNQPVGTGHDTLGISFMRYKDDNSCNVNRNNRDLIPDSIKPPGLAGRCLLVLWYQKVNTSNNRENKTWIAYRDLTGETCMRAPQSSVDGKCMVDASTVMVRVLERMVDGSKTSDISVYYGDASSPSNPPSGSYYGGCARTSSRVPNSKAYDYDLNRQVYYKNSTYTAGTSPFPAWTPMKVGEWNSTVDYYTFIENGGGYPVNCSACDWTGYNSDDSYVATNFPLLSDGGTIRTSLYLSPSSGTFPSTRYEVAYHAFAAGSGNYATGYKDFALRFLIPNSDTLGGSSSAVLH